MTEVPTESELLELANQFHNEKLVDTSELIIQPQMILLHLLSELGSRPDGHDC